MLKVLIFCSCDNNLLVGLIRMGLLLLNTISLNGGQTITFSLLELVFLHCM